MFVFVLLALIAIYTICFFYPSFATGVFYPSIPIIYWGITIYYLIRYRRKSLFCFELFFAISFYLCSFLTLFLLPIMDAYESRAFIVDDVLILKAYALSIIGYICYILGLVVWGKNAAPDKVFSIHSDVTNKNMNTFANILCTINILLLFMNGGTRMFTMYSDTNLYASDRLSGFAVFLSFAIITYIVSIVTNFSLITSSSHIGAFSILKKISFLFIVNSILLIGTFLASGYRSNAIQIIIPLLLAYQIKIRHIKPLSVLLMLFGGAFLMFFIGVTRSGAAFDTGNYNMLTYLRDFKPANAATIFLIDYVNTSGPTGGSNMLFPLLSIIPGLQFFTSAFIDISKLYPVSSAYFTLAFSSDSGFGTSIIGDLYYTFGFGGVVVLMFLLGSFLYRLSRFKNNYELAMFLVFSGNAMFAPRVEYCYILRSIAWSVIFLYLVQFLSKTLKR